MTGPWPGQTCVRPPAPPRARAAAAASRGRRRACRRGGRRPSCPGRGPCRRSAPRPRRGGGTTASPRCGPGCRRRASPARRPRRRRRRPAPRRPSRCCGSSARTPHPTRSAKAARPSEWSGWPWVSSTAPTSPATAATASRCASSSGPGSTTTERRPPGSRSTQVLVPSSVMIPGLGASTHRRALAERPARPAGHDVAARRRAATASPRATSRSGSAQVAAVVVHLHLGQDRRPVPLRGGGQRRSRPS